MRNSFCRRKREAFSRSLAAKFAFRSAGCRAAPDGPGQWIEEQHSTAGRKTSWSATKTYEGSTQRTKREKLPRSLRALSSNSPLGKCRSSSPRAPRNHWIPFGRHQVEGASGGVFRKLRLLAGIPSRIALIPTSLFCSFVRSSFEFRRAMILQTHPRVQVMYSLSLFTCGG